MGISAQVIADSISPTGKRITTLAVEFPTFLTKEINTHRMFSRSYMSSRAVPVQTMLKRVQEDPFIPIHWGKNQKGMQAQEECDNLINVKYLNKGGQDEFHSREVAWKTASLQAGLWAGSFLSAGYHKQVVNRLLEPFSYTVGIITSTEWQNFFQLRDHPAAQPELQELARCMRKAMDESFPTLLLPGEWYLPFVDQEREAQEFYSKWRAEESMANPLGFIPIIDILKKVSVARCARVSYQSNSRPKPFTLEEDLALYDRLLVDQHLGPFEHIATPLVNPTWEEYLAIPEFERKWEKGVTHVDVHKNFWSANYRGWAQYRHLIPTSHGL